MLKTLSVTFSTGNYSYQNSKSYDYMVKSDLGVSVGDQVLVYTNDGRYAVAKVNRIADGVSSKATKTIVAVLNDRVAKAYETREQDVKAVRNKLDRLEELLSKEAEVNKYRFLAANNAEAAQLLRDLGMA
jgi:hypothetical protein